MNNSEILKKVCDDFRQLRAENEGDKKVVAYNENNERINAELVEAEEESVISDDRTLVLTDEDGHLTNPEKRRARKLIIEFNNEITKPSPIVLQSIAEVVSSNIWQNAIKEAAFGKSVSVAVSEMHRAMQSMHTSLFDSVIQFAGVSEAIKGLGQELEKTDSRLREFASAYVLTAPKLDELVRWNESIYTRFNLSSVVIPNRTLDLHGLNYPVIVDRRAAQWETREPFEGEIDEPLLQKILELQNHPIGRVILARVPIPRIAAWVQDGKDWMELQPRAANANLLLPKQAVKIKRGMNDDTRGKLKQLVQIRAERTRNKRITIAWTVACQEVGIDPKTAIRYMGELRRRWHDPTYNAEFKEFKE